MKDSEQRGWRKYYIDIQVLRNQILEAMTEGSDLRLAAFTSRDRRSGLTEVVSLFPEYATGHYLLAYEKVLQRDFDAAIDEYLEAHRLGQFDGLCKAGVLALHLEDDRWHSIAEVAFQEMQSPSSNWHVRNARYAFMLCLSPECKNRSELLKTANETLNKQSGDGVQRLASGLASLRNEDFERAWSFFEQGGLRLAARKAYAAIAAHKLGNDEFAVDELAAAEKLLKKARQRESEYPQNFRFHPVIDNLITELAVMEGRQVILTSSGLTSAEDGAE